MKFRLVVRPFHTPGECGISQVQTFIKSPLWVLDSSSFLSSRSRSAADLVDCALASLEFESEEESSD